jgi:hypothetical protein
MIGNDLLYEFYGEDLFLKLKACAMHRNLNPAI